MRCIFGHVRALSRDLLYSNHSLSNFSGVAFLFLHSLGHVQTVSGAAQIAREQSFVIVLFRWESRVK